MNRDETIVKNLPLVTWTIKRFTRDGGRVLNLDHEDAFAWGVLGLIGAVDNYNPARGAFASYAVLRIRGAVIDASRRADPLGRQARADIHRLDQAVAQLAYDLGTTPSHQQIADALGTTAARVAAIIRDGEIVRASFDEDWVGAADADLDPARAAECAAEVQELAAALTTLPDRDGKIIELYYRAHLSMRAIGETLGISESRVCGLHRRALLRLRAVLTDRAA